MVLGNGGVIVCDTEGSSTAHANYISERTVDVCAPPTLMMQFDFPLEVLGALCSPPVRTVSPLQDGSARYVCDMWTHPHTGRQTPLA
jgi:hypothetical protein